MPSLLVVGLSFLVTFDGIECGHQPLSPDGQFQVLREEYESAFQAFIKADAEAKTKEEKAAVDTHPGRSPQCFSDRFMDLARAHPVSTAAEDALVWVASHVMFGRETEEAKRLLIRDHIRSPKLAPVFAFQYWSCGSEATERLLREALARNPQREVQGLACYWLARFLMNQAAQSRVAKRGDRVLPPPGGVVDEGWGPNYLNRLQRLNPEALDGEAQVLLARVVRDYRDVPHNDKLRHPGTLGDAASAHLHTVRDLAVGKLAPEIEGDGIDGRRFRLSDHRGRVVVLDFGSHFYCGPCRALYPEQRSLVKRLKGRPFTLVTIDADPDRSAVKAAWEAEGNSWPCIYDGLWDGPINTAWNIQQYPTIYVLDHKGTIRHKDLTGKALEEAVDGLLKELETSKRARE
jgi:thiol-disulfide isomerase/thioredoxin